MRWKSYAISKKLFGYGALNSTGNSDANPEVYIGAT